MELTEETLQTLVGQIAALEPDRNIENRDKAVRILRNALAAHNVEAPRELSIGVNCLLAVRKLMTRLGIATNESIEGFGAEIEHNLFSLARVANAFMDSVQRHSLTAPQPSQPAASEAARNLPVVVLAYSTKGHNKPCGQTLGANGCGEFVTIYYGDIGAAENAARDRIYDMEKSGHRFNWVLVMRSDEEAYSGPAMTIERLDRAEGE